MMGTHKNYLGIAFVGNGCAFELVRKLLLKVVGTNNNYVRIVFVGGG